MLFYYVDISGLINSAVRSVSRRVWFLAGVQRGCFFYRYVQLQGENLGVFLPFRRFLFFLENLMDFFKKSDIIIDW